MSEGDESKTIDRLMFAVIQEQDVNVAIRALTRLDIKSTRFPSTGGFLGRRSATLLIGYLTGQEKSILQALHRSCRTRTEYVTIPLEGSPMPLPAPTPIIVGGATIFSFEVERYEEL